MKKTITAMMCAAGLTFGSMAQAEECTDELGTIVTELVELNESGVTAGEFDFLIGAVTATIGSSNLFDVLTNEDRTVTLFAPNDQAFLNTAVALQEAGILDLTGVDTSNTMEVVNALAGALTLNGVIEVLAYHVSYGNRTSKYVVKRDGKTIRMANKEFVNVNGLSINDSPLDLAYIDIPACNGVIHVITEGVLIPDLSN